MRRDVNEEFPARQEEAEKTITQKRKTFPMVFSQIVSTRHGAKTR